MNGADQALAGVSRRLDAVRRWLPLLLTVAAVALALWGLLQVRDRAETLTADLATVLPLGFAFGAGMVAAVNPCGFMMLPSYVALFLGIDEEREHRLPRWRQLARAAGFAAIATLAFLVVFSPLGLAIGLGARSLTAVFPYAGLSIGVLMIGLGMGLWSTHGSIGLPGADRVVLPRPGRSPGTVFLFGLAYAVASLACTLPVFLLVVGTAISSDGVLNALLQLISYGLGMGAVLLAVTIGAVMAKGFLLRARRRVAPHVHAAAALFLVAAGGYLVYYWLFFADDILG